MSLFPCLSLYLQSTISPVNAGYVVWTILFRSRIYDADVNGAYYRCKADTVALLGIRYASVACVLYQACVLLQGPSFVFCWRGNPFTSPLFHLFFGYR